MTLEQRLILLAQAIGGDIKTLTVAQGSLTSLTTTAKSNLVAAINELKTIIDGLAGGGAVINDAAGDGDTTVTWSANKIFDSIAAAKAALKNELVDGAGAALDTLNELADALNNDPNFAASGDYGWLANTASPLTLGGQALYVPELANSSEYGPFMRIDLMPDLPM